MNNDILNGIWPEWKINKMIGRGSFGVVYEAARSERQVKSSAAIKVISIPQNESEIDSLRAEGLDENSIKAYFEEIVNDCVSEIQLMESFKGVQNIVSVEDYKVVERTGRIGWTIYIRMELLQPFNTYIKDRTLTEKEVIKLGCDICTALELCGKRKVIHRDIKPENIFVNSFGDFKLGDFGIARKLENVTSGLSQKGTYYYMAPEMIKGTHYDATVDLYSLGLLLYRLMNKNRLPFLTEKQLLHSKERMEAIRRRLEEELLPAPSDATPAMAQVILCACSPDPYQRFSDASAMKKALLCIADRDKDPQNETMIVRKTKQQVLSPNLPNTDDARRRKKKTSTVFICITVALILVVINVCLFFVIIPRVSSRDRDKKETVVASKDLSVKQEEYTQSLEEKNKILSNAAAHKDAGDYVSALTLLKKAREDYSKDKDYENVYTTYCTEYKNAAISEADNLAASGAYEEAIVKMNEVSDIIGEDVEITKKIQEYTTEKEKAEVDLTEPIEEQIANEPFYGIWCYGAKDLTAAQDVASSLSNQGFDAQVFVTTQWSNLVREKWYVVTAGVYLTEEEADVALSSVQTLYPDAYIKYSGNWQG